MAIDANNRYAKQVQLLVRVLPRVDTENCFALKGGTVRQNQTKVTWGFSGHLDYPFNIWMLFIDFEKMIGDDLQIGLGKLKTKLEKNKNEKY